MAKDEKRPLLAALPQYGAVSSSGADAIKKPKKTLGMLAYATRVDFLLMVIGTIASVVHGAGFPLLSIVLGGMTTTFLKAQNSEFVTGHSPVQAVVSDGLDGISKEQFDEEVRTYCLYYLLIGALMFVSSYLQIACWESCAERQVNALRRNYLKAILRQEIGWFDDQQSGNLTSRLSDDLERVREGMGDKLSLLIQMTAAFVSGFLVGFVFNWQMTLVMAAFTPLTAATGAWMARSMASRTHVEQEKYAVAGAIADEALSSVRTVMALNGQQHEIDRYEVALEDGRKTGLIKYMYMALGQNTTNMVIYISYAVAFWFGSRLIVWDPSFDRGTIFTVFFAVMSGSMSLGGAVPHLGSFGMARGACRTVLKTINNVLKDVSFQVEPGQKIALVGPSGCGKSTIVSLILRFYDPDSGTVSIDGIELTDMNVRFLRDSVGVVSQEPVLFDGTIESNIRLGNETCSREQVIAACKQANAFDFIQLLPDGLQTRVGERGVQLSGGQKQRIAIARSLVKNPAILLLDEATSALDTESEGVVQAALDQAQEGRTTIIVAHRLSTIREADRILVFRDGAIVETGSHEELMHKRGMFYEMVMAQQINQTPPVSAVGDGEATGDEASVSRSSVLSPTRKSTTGSRRKITVASMQSHRSSGQQMKILEDEMKTGVLTQTTGVLTRTTRVKPILTRIQESNLQPVSLRAIFEINRASWHFLFFGLVGCCISGIVPPLFALFYSQIFSVFSEPVDQLQRDALFWSAMFISCGVINSIGFFISANMLGRCGEALTKMLRLKAFTNLLRQELAFFDEERHNTGKLCTRLATDVPNVRYVFTRLPVVVSSIVTLIGAIAIGFVFGWQLATLLLLIIPLIIGSGYFEMKMQYGKQIRDTALLEEAGKVAAEAVGNIRTVAALNKQLAFCMLYEDHLREPFRQNMCSAHTYGGVFAFSQSLIFFMYALAFWIGSIMVSNAVMEPINVYRVFFAIAFCGQSVGQISSFIPDVVKARLAGALIFNMINREPLIDSLSKDGIRPKLRGEIQLKNVHFTYPTRPNARILQGLNLRVHAGQTVALVGYSGCGKSTVLSLLERFYDCSRGQIFLDENNVRGLNIRMMRHQIGMVSQEPTLFDCSIRENIIYGVEEGAAVTHAQVVQAAQKANIHDFILSLPLGYDTCVGERGTQLSGGQKQRIAIARALIRNPTILLLDEATSALDTESEKVVQKALDVAREGRTCLVVAHRLSTVQNADQVVVLNEGKVSEQGTPMELLQKKGIYYSLCQTQKLIESK